nr:type II secretion system F family protein [uncultured Clostridium sp.]
MPNFSYKALGRDGKEVRGVLQAESEAAAASRIRENYPILLSISQKKEKKRPDDGSLLEMEIGSRRIKTKKLAILCSQFAITLHSGMTVARAMRMLADQNEDKRIRKIMGAAAEEVAAGSTVASALEKYSDRFPLTFIETIRAGEQSGTLERSFDRLQKFYEKSYKTTEKIKGAMTYPLFVVAVAVVVLIIVMAKVMDNALLSEDVRSMRAGIEQGRSLVECLQGKKYFPPTMVDMYSVGEETGELEETLDNVADYYTNEADYRIQRLLALLEPTMLVVLAIFAGIIVVSIYLPIFTMYDLM